jgi:hypothetical protein
MKNKKQLFSRLPLGNINISFSSDRPQYQRKQMKKLHNQLAAFKANGKHNLTIKFIKGLPSLVKLNAVVKNFKHF